MKSLIRLFGRVLQDCSIRCGTTTTRDFLTVTRRVKHEGLSFMTITLGDFAQDFERSLELGQIDPTFFRSFRKNGLIPRFLSGIVGQVFDINGKLLEQPSVDAIFYVRQICRMWKKIKLPCTGERDRAAVAGYLKVESDLSMLDINKFGPDHFDDFGRVSDILWSQVLGSVSRRICERDLTPRHGPGVTATKVLPNQKYFWKQWHQRLEPYFPSDSFCFSSIMGFEEHGSEIDYLNPAQEQPVRVVFVPKTLKTPRVIAIEPACMQYTQQSLLTILVDALENHPLTRGHINFSDQSVNAKLALSSSRDRTLATLDLSEASDRVHHALVSRMLKSAPLVRDAIFACRSTRATLPTGQTIQLEKFASMGSALCFPIESMVFYTILISREVRRLRLPMKPSSIRLVLKNLYVYGDDLILPTDGVPSASFGLSALGLKVNTHKSFSRGNFRESCGMDAYNGEEVTTIFLRNKLPRSRRDVSGIVSLVAMSNQLFDKKMYATATFIEEYLSKLGLRIPYVRKHSSCVGFVRDVTPTIHRWNTELHRPEVKGYVIVPKFIEDIIDGYHGLTKWFLQGLNPRVDHWKRSVGTGSLAIKSRWCAA